MDSGAERRATVAALQAQPARRLIPMFENKRFLRKR